MEIKKRVAIRFTLLTVSLLVLLLIVGFSDSHSPFEMPGASADTGYGIQGQMAPELNLSNWIDGNGSQIDPVRLSDYRGKVVYLYFFQDW